MIFAKEFLEPDDDTLTDEIYSVDDFLGRINHIVETYYSFDDGTITKFVLDRDQTTGIIYPINLALNVRPSVALDDAMVRTESYTLSAEEPLGPFNVSLAKLKNLLARTASMEFKFWLSSIVPTQFLSAPFRWSVTIHFANTGGIFTGHVVSSRHIENMSLLYRLGWVPIALIILSTVSISLQLKATFATFQIYWRTRSAFRSIPKEKLQEVYENLWLPGVIPVYEWKEIPFGVKTDFFGSWYGLEILGEVSLLISCFHGLISDLGLPISDFSRVFLGTGFLIICVGFARYLEYWKKFYMLIVTMQGSFQRNLRFVISVFPLYMGFCTCGFIIFSPYTDDFASLDKSAITLFALLNGDDIHTQFDRIYARYPYPIVGQVFLFTFIIMFITLVLNIFLFIIEDAYHAAKDFINTNAERHSRVHRRKGSQGREGPSSAIPRLGDIEFDLPTLFDVIEASVEHIPSERKKHIRKRDSSRLSSVALTVASPAINGDPSDARPFGAFSLSTGGGVPAMSSSMGGPGGRALGHAVSATFGGRPGGHDWGGREHGQAGPVARTRSGGLARPSSAAQDASDPTSGLRSALKGSRGIERGDLGTDASAMDDEEDYATGQGPVSSSSYGGIPTRAASGPSLIRTNSSGSGSRMVGGADSSTTPRKGIRVVSFGDTPSAPAKISPPLSPGLMSPSDLNAAIASTIANSQADFLLEVDEKMKQMRERFANKLQADLEALLGGGAPATTTTAPSSSGLFPSSPSSMAPAVATGSPSRPPIPSFIDTDDEEGPEEGEE